MSNCFLVRDLRIRVLLRGAAGGRPREIANGPGGIVYDTSHRANTSHRASRDFFTLTEAVKGNLKIKMQKAKLWNCFAESFTSNWG